MSSPVITCHLISVCCRLEKEWKNEFTWFLKLKMIVDTLILKMNIIRMKIFGLEECLWMGFPETDGRSNFIFSCFLKKTKRSHTYLEFTAFRYKMFVTYVKAVISINK